MFRGTIALIVDGGFGFITGEQEDVVFARDAVAGEGFDNLRQGHEVEYELADQRDPRRNMLEARHLQVIRTNGPAQQAPVPLFSVQQNP